MDDIEQHIMENTRDIGLLERKMEEVETTTTRELRNAMLEIKRLNEAVSKLRADIDSVRGNLTNLSDLTELSEKLERGLKLVAAQKVETDELMKRLDIVIKNHSLKETWGQIESHGRAITTSNKAIRTIFCKVRQMLINGGATNSEMGQFNIDLQDTPPAIHIRDGKPVNPAQIIRESGATSTNPKD